MNQITKSIFELAKRKGVRFNFEKGAQEIIVEKGKAKGIKVAEHTILYDKVISNMDIYSTYKHLMPDVKHPERTLKQERSTSAVIFYWGVKKDFPPLDVHNIFFSEDYKAEFEAMSAGSIFEDPTVYVNITKKYVPEDAPKNCENWFVMVNAPYNNGQDWDKLIKKTSEESLLDPRTIDSRTSSHLGALYGSSSNSKMAAFMRHANFSSRIKDLYFCGGSVHPGGGIPLCMLSAKIVDDIIHE